MATVVAITKSLTSLDFAAVPLVIKDGDGYKCPGPMPVITYDSAVYQRLILNKKIYLLAQPQEVTISDDSCGLWLGKDFLPGHSLRGPQLPDRETADFLIGDRAYIFIDSYSNIQTIIHDWLVAASITNINHWFSELGELCWRVAPGSIWATAAILRNYDYLDQHILTVYYRRSRGLDEFDTVGEKEIAIARAEVMAHIQEYDTDVFGLRR